MENILGECRKPNNKVEAKLNIIMIMKINNLEKASLLGKNYSIGVPPKTLTGERYILCDNAPSNFGKSQVLSEVADFYLNNPSSFLVLESKLFKSDRWIVVREISTNKIILVQTQGDKLGCYSKTLTYLQNSKHPFVDIIICACHPNDNTHKIVKALSKKAFNLYYFQNFSPSPRKWIQPASSIVKNGLKDAIVKIVNQL